MIGSLESLLLAIVTGLVVVIIVRMIQLDLRGSRNGRAETTRRRPR